MRVGMPYCEGQGIGAVCGRAALDSPRTVHHPQRTCAVGGAARLVSLDVPESIQIPRQIAMHHREGDSAPAAERTSFEGDNMLLVPAFRCTTTSDWLLQVTVASPCVHDRESHRGWCQP